MYWRWFVIAGVLNVSLNDWRQLDVIERINIWWHLVASSFHGYVFVLVKVNAGVSNAEQLQFDSFVARSQCRVVNVISFWYGSLIVLELRIITLVWLLPAIICANGGITTVRIPVRTVSTIAIFTTTASTFVIVKMFTYPDTDFNSKKQKQCLYKNDIHLRSDNHRHGDCYASNCCIHHALGDHCFFRRIYPGYS